MKVFAFDGAFARLMERVFDLVLLHILWVVCSIPIITIGASTTALCTMTVKMVTREDGYVFKGFFKAFVENFKKSTMIWVYFLGFFIWCIVMIALSFQFQGEGFKVIALMEASILILGFAAFQYVFFIQAKYENTIGNTIKNAIILSLKFLPYTALMIAIMVTPIFITAYATQIYPIMIFLWLFFGSSGIALMQSYVINKVW